MEYTDLEDDYPNETGFYKVKVQRENQGVLITDASWSGDSFVLTDYELKDADYIFSWLKV